MSTEETSSGFYQFLAKPCDNDKGLRSKDILFSLLETTTAHGLPHIANSKGLLKRGFWITLPILCFCGLIFHLTLVSRYYVSFPVSVSISLLHKEELVFPAVTLCNMSPVRKSLWQAVQSGEASILTSMDPENSSILLNLNSNRKKRAIVCPSGWSQSSANSNVCYYVSTVSTTYTTAESTCASSGATLATIFSQDDQNAVEAVANTNEFWLGLQFHSGTWRWADGSLGYAAYENWVNPYPVMGIGTCVNLRWDGKWRNNGCGGYRHFVCQLGTSVGGTTSVSTDFTTQTTANPTTEAITTTHVQSTAAPVFLLEPSNDTCDCACCNSANDLYAITVDPNPIDTLNEGQAPKTLNGSAYQERLQLREDFSQGEDLLEELAGLDDTKKKDYGFTKEDLILDCQYAGSDCTYNDFREFFNPIHGNCYVFNSGWNHGMKTSKRSGKRHGLHLTLNLGQDDYISDVGDTAGMRVVINTNKRMSFPEDEGITVTPGLVTHVGLRQTVLSRLSGNYGDCKDPSERNVDSNVYEEFFPVEYSQMACYKTCQQRHVISECSCADAYFPPKGRAFGNRNVPICSTRNITQDDCKYGVQLKFERNELECDCPNPCRDTIFSTKISSGAWPSDIQKVKILSRLGSKISGLLNDTSDPEKYRRNLLKLVIYYEEFNYESITEEVAYPGASFASDIGGILGLWFGCSLLTLAELIEFVSDLLVLKCRKCKKRKVADSGNARHLLSDMATPSKSRNTLPPLTASNSAPSSGPATGAPPVYDEVVKKRRKGSQKGQKGQNRQKEE